MGFHKFCQGSMGSARVWYLYGLHSRVGNLQHFLRYYNDASIIPKVNLHNTPASPPCCRCTFCLTLQAVCSYMAGMFNTPEDHAGGAVSFVADFESKSPSLERHTGGAVSLVADFHNPLANSLSLLRALEASCVTRASSATMCFRFPEFYHHLGSP